MVGNKTGLLDRHVKHHTETNNYALPLQKAGEFFDLIRIIWMALNGNISEHLYLYLHSHTGASAVGSQQR